MLKILFETRKSGFVHIIVHFSSEQYLARRDNNLKIEWCNWTTYTWHGSTKINIFLIKSSEKFLIFYMKVSYENICMLSHLFMRSRIKAPFNNS